MRVRKEEEKERKRSDWPENQNLRLYYLTKQTPTRERKEIVKLEQKHERKWRRSFTRELKEEERLKQDKKDEWDWDWLNEVNSITTEPESVERKDETKEEFKTTWQWKKERREREGRLNSLFMRLYGVWMNEGRQKQDKKDGFSITTEPLQLGWTIALPVCPLWNSR